MLSIHKYSNGSSRIYTRECLPIFRKIVEHSYRVCYTHRMDELKERISLLENKIRGLADRL